jgi:hypothetical protein
MFLRACAFQRFSYSRFFRFPKIGRARFVIRESSQIARSDSCALLRCLRRPTSCINSQYLSFVHSIRRPGFERPKAHTPSWPPIPPISGRQDLNQKREGIFRYSSSLPRERMFGDRGPLSLQHFLRYWLNPQQTLDGSREEECGHRKHRGGLSRLTALALRASA